MSHSTTAKLTILFIIFYSSCSHNNSQDLKGVFLQDKDEQYWDLIMTQTNHDGINIKLDRKNKTPIISLLFKKDGRLVHLYNYDITHSTDYNNITDVQLNPDSWRTKYDTVSFGNNEGYYSNKSNDSTVIIGNEPVIRVSLKYHITKINDSLIALSFKHNNNLRVEVYALSRYQTRTIK